jgi:hypothetical protein
MPRRGLAALALALACFGLLTSWLEGLALPLVLGALAAVLALDRVPTGRLPSGAALAIVAALVGAPHLGTLRDALEPVLRGLPERTGARLRLGWTPSIHPPLLRADVPQTFYVHAPAGREVVLDLGVGRIDGVPLGHGVFRVRVDPRALEPLAVDGPMRVHLEVDGAIHPRQLQAVRPRPRPGPLHALPDGRLAALTAEDDALWLWARGGSPRRVPVGDAPVALDVEGTRLFVGHRHDDLEVRDLRGTLLHTVATGPGLRDLDAGPTGLLLAFDGPRPRVEVRDPGGTLEATLPSPDRPRFVRWVGPDRFVVALRRPGQLQLFDRRGPTPVGPPLAVGRPPLLLLARPDRLLTATSDPRPEGSHLGNHFIDDTLLWVDVTDDGLRLAGRRATAGRSPRQDRPGDVDVGAGPVDAAWGPDGAARVLFGGSADVWSLDGPDGEPSIVRLEGAAPRHVAVFEDGALAIAYPAEGVIDLWRQGRAAPGLAFGEARPSREARLREIGERTFFEATRSGVRCASCHLDASTDGGRHNIGGRRFAATLDVRGLAGTPPYLRDGSYATVGRLVGLAEGLYRGYRRRVGGRRRGLERYLASLAREDFARPRDLARERRGLDAFVEAGCPRCHAPPAFTDLGRHLASTLFGADAEPLDTPSLLGAGRSAPYLSDGRAETLRAIFEEHDPAGRHGVWRRLDDRAQSDLLAFLEAL